MKILIFDTETTGLPNKKDPRLEKQPRIVQFAGIIGDLQEDGTWTKEEEINILINPGIKIPHFTSSIHGIYDIDVKDKPTAKEVMPGILEKINSVDFIVAHNLRFDETLVKLEVQRLQQAGMVLDYIPKGKICTMVAGTPICRIKRKTGKGYKVPKLQELFYFLFGKYFSGAHDAMIDVRATGISFVELVRRKHLSVKEIEEKQVSLF